MGRRRENYHYTQTVENVSANGSGDLPYGDAFFVDAQYPSVRRLSLRNNKEGYDIESPQGS